MYPGLCAGGGSSNFIYVVDDANPGTAGIADGVICGPGTDQVYRNAVDTVNQSFYPCEVISPP